MGSTPRPKRTSSTSLGMERGARRDALGEAGALAAALQEEYRRVSAFAAPHRPGGEG
jgi:hypothetical protein